jgi:hypothetical protein
MIVILGSIFDYSYFDDDEQEEPFEADCEDDYDALFKCPACSKVVITYANPEDSYGSFQISCSCNSYFGIEGWSRISDTDPRVLEIIKASTYDITPKYWWELTLAEFTHYDGAEDRTIDEEPEWIPFPEHKFWLSQDQVYNRTFLTTLGEFHFGFD